MLERMSIVGSYSGSLILDVVGVGEHRSGRGGKEVVFGGAVVIEAVGVVNGFGIVDK